MRTNLYFYTFWSTHKTMPIPLMIIGLILCIGSLTGAYWLASFICQMSPSGCNTDGLSLFVNLMLSREGLFFWASAGAGLMFFLIGFRARTKEKL